MFPPQSTPSKRPKRRVESYRIYKRPYSACSQSSRPSPSSYEKATHGRLVGPTLSTPRGDNNYNQYRPLCEVCPRDRDKVVGTLQGVMVWGGICHGHKTPLIFIDGNLTAIRYRDNVLTPIVLPFVGRYNVTFQQDNARPHVARICMDFLATNHVNVLPWPAYSPDLSPIEHIWDILDRKVRARDPPPSTIPGLRQALADEWDNIPLATVNRLINSMHRRIRAAIATRGGHTRY